MIADLRALTLRVAWSYHGTPYRWGGDDPSGFDCSGLVVEVGQSAGWFPRGHDATADGLMGRYPLVDTPDPGDLVFWLDRNGRAYHVGILIDPTTHYIGADGGGRLVQSEADAWRGNAFVKVRPLSSRGGTHLFASPFISHPAPMPVRGA